MWAPCLSSLVCFASFYVIAVRRSRRFHSIHSTNLWMRSNSAWIRIPAHTCARNSLRIQHFIFTFVCSTSARSMCVCVCVWVCTCDRSLVRARAFSPSSFAASSLIGFIDCSMLIHCSHLCDVVLFVVATSSIGNFLNSNFRHQFNGTSLTRGPDCVRVSSSLAVFLILSLSGGTKRCQKYSDDAQGGFASGTTSIWIGAL